MIRVLGERHPACRWQLTWRRGGTDTWDCLGPAPQPDSMSLEPHHASAVRAAPKKHRENNSKN